MTARQTARNVLTAVAVLAALYVVWLVRDVVLLVVLALFVAVALSAPVGALQHRLRIPRALAIGLCYLALLGVIVLVGAVVIPPLVDQIAALTRQVPRWVAEVEGSDTFRAWDEQYHLVAELKDQASRLPSLLSGAAAELETVTVGLFERAAEAIAILAIAFLLLLDAPRTTGWLYRRLSPEREDQARRLAGQAAQAIGGYCAGVFAVSALAGLVAFLAMTILGIPYAVPLAVQMAFFALLPLVGSAIGAFVIAVVAIFDGPVTAAVWVVFFAGYQQLETHVLAPTIYRKTVDMRPVLVIVSVLVGASLLGILGALLAIPAAATIQIAVQEWWRMGHPEPEPQ